MGGETKLALDHGPPWVGMALFAVGVGTRHHARPATAGNTSDCGCAWTPTAAVVAGTAHPRPRRGRQRVFTNASTSSAWPGTLTPRHSRTSVPLASITKVLRSIPRTCLPY